MPDPSKTNSQAAADADARARAAADYRAYHKQLNSSNPFPFREKKFAQESAAAARQRIAAEAKVAKKQPRSWADKAMKR